MDNISEADPIRGRSFAILEILSFLGGLEILHRGTTRAADILFPRLSEIWYPVCVRLADLLLLIGGLGALRRWRWQAATYPKGLRRDGAIAGLAAGIVLGIGIQLVRNLALLPRSFWYRPEVRESLHYQWAHFPWLAVLLFFAMGALREEAIWRGWVLEELERWWGSGWALIVSAAGFGLWHLGKGGRTGLEIIEIALNGGVLMGAAYLWSRRLWLPIGLHVATNVVTTFFNGYMAFPDAALPPVTFEAQGLWQAATVLVCIHVELLMGTAFVFLTVASGRWKPRSTHPACGAATV